MASASEEMHDGKTDIGPRDAALHEEVVGEGQAELVRSHLTRRVLFRTDVQYGSPIAHVALVPFVD